MLDFNIMRGMVAPEREKIVSTSSNHFLHLIRKLIFLVYFIRMTICAMVLVPVLWCFFVCFLIIIQINN